MINDDMAYREEVEQLVDWCRENNLILNVDKTKEMIVDVMCGQVMAHLEHCITGKARTAASALSATNEEIPSAPTHPRHLLQEHHREHPDQLHLCGVWRLQGLCWKNMKGVVRTAENIIGPSLPPIQDIALKRCVS